METKLILLDLDETLLHSDKTISDYSAQIFERCRQRGILVGFCTSRGKPNIIPFEKKINPDICICNGGAVIYRNGNLIHATSFSIEETRALLKTAGTVCGADCEITLDTIDRIFWNRQKDKSTDYADNSIYDDFENFVQPAMKICVQTDDPEKAKEISQSVPACDFLPFSDIPWYKFSPASATKESAILILCQNLGISPQEILAFGDDFNDIGMLKLCGKGIAMGNAIPQVKAAADGITKTNNEDGAACYVENFILKD
ncbi:MAG: HAD family hydrolase [Treponema sp.]